MKKTISTALTAVMVMSATANVFAEYDKNYLDTTGRSIGQVADMQGYEYEDFKILYGLPADLPAYESENTAHNNLPVYLYAQMMGADFNALKTKYGWGDDITEQTPIGRALDSTTLEKYVGADIFDAFKAEYGLGEDVTLETPWGQVRPILEQAEIKKINSTRFSDVGYSHWAYDYIYDMNNGGIIEGYDDGTYAPEKTITRAEFSKILFGAAEKAGIKVDGADAEFTDVSVDAWYSEYVNKIGSYMFADLEGEYRPDEIARREDVAVALVKLKGYQTSAKDLSGVFVDAAEITEGNKKYVATAVENGLLDGFEDDTFRGNEGITRAQAAAVVSRAIDSYTVSPLMDEVVIKSGDREITAGDIAFFANNMIVMGYDAEMAVNYIKDDVVNTIKKAAVARETGITLSESDTAIITTSMAQMAAQSGGLKKYKKELSKTGADINFVKNLITDEKYASMLDAILGNAAGGENMNEDELKEEFIKSFYRAKHILVNEEDSEGVLKGEALAENLLDRAKNGEDFDAMIEKYSKDPGSKNNPDGYIFTDGEMVSEFENCVKSLGKNKFGICKSAYGYHVIKRLPLDEREKNFENWFENSKSAIADSVGENVKDKAFELLYQKHQISVDVNEEVIRELIESL